MKFIKLMLAVSAAAMLATACKDDKESDILPPDDVDYTTIALNEVCGAGPAAADPNGEADWVELFNRGAQTVDLSGVQIVKTDETGESKTVYTIPSGRTLSSGGYLTVNYPNELSAKISNKKQVVITLKTPAGADIDAFDRNARIAEGTGLADDAGNKKGHTPGGSYARIPNGTGNWKIVQASTPGVANAETPDPDPDPLPDPDPAAEKDYSGLVLNELNGNKPVKFIEICNTLDKTVDMEGVQLRKNDENPVIWIAPAGMTIAAKGRIVLISDQTTNDTVNGFTGGLSAKKSVKIELLSPDGSQLDLFRNLSPDGKELWDVEPPKYNGEATGQSYGRYPDATGDWYMMSPSQDAANTAGTTAISMEVTPDGPTGGNDYTGLALNELDGNTKFIELYNGSEREMDISGVQLRKDEDKIVYIAPEGTKIAAKGFLSLPGNAANYATGFSGGLSADKSVMIQLLDPDGGDLDLFKNMPKTAGEAWGGGKGRYDGKSGGNSFARYPDGTGSWYLSTATSGAANAQGTDGITW